MPDISHFFGIDSFPHLPDLPNLLQGFSQAPSQGFKPIPADPPTQALHHRFSEVSQDLVASDPKLGGLIDGINEDDQGWCSRHPENLILSYNDPRSISALQVDWTHPPSAVDIWGTRFDGDTPRSLLHAGPEIMEGGGLKDPLHHDEGLFTERFILKPGNIKTLNLKFSPHHGETTCLRHITGIA